MRKTKDSVRVISGQATRPRAPVSPQVTALRRRVWIVRSAFVLAILVLSSAYSLAMDQRSAHLRTPEIALSEGGQVISDAQAGLASHVVQLALQASASTYAGKPFGPLSPAALTVQYQVNRWTARISGLGTVGESGYPVLTPMSVSIAEHNVDRRGLVDEITLECTYSFCWDRSATRGVVLLPGEQLPRAAKDDYVGGASLLRYTDGARVVDRITMRMNNRSLRWEISVVERVSRETIR